LEKKEGRKMQQPKDEILGNKNRGTPLRHYPFKRDQLQKQVMEDKGEVEKKKRIVSLGVTRERGLSIHVYQMGIVPRPIGPGKKKPK